MAFSCVCIITQNLLANRDTIGLNKLTCIIFTALSEDFLVVVNYITDHTSVLLAYAVKAGTPFQMIFDYGGSLVNVQNLGCHLGINILIRFFQNSIVNVCNTCKKVI